MKKLFLFMMIISTGFGMSIPYNVAALGNNEANVIVVPTARLIKQDKIILGNSNAISIAFSPDGMLLASGDNFGGIMLWDVGTGSLKKIIKKGVIPESDSVWSVSSLAFSPDGKTLADISWKTISLWNVASGKRIKTLTGNALAFSIAFSPDGKVLAACDNNHEINFWDLASFKKIKTFKPTQHNNKIDTSYHHIAFSPNGQLIVGRSLHEAVVIDLSRGYQERIIKGITYDQFAFYENDPYPFRTDSEIVFSPKGNVIASGSNNKTVVLIDVATGNIVKKFIGHSNPILAVTFSPAGNVLASAGYDKSIILWDIDTGNIIKTLSGHSEKVYSIAFSPDGKLLASASDQEKSIVLWDTIGIYLLNVFNKGEYETSKEYEERLDRTEIPYITAITLGKYDADRGLFEAELAGIKFYVSSSREKASVIADHKDKLRLESKLRYFDAKSVQLINPVLVDDVSKERFAVLKTIEGPAIAYTPKPAPKETSIENIHDIPDFKSLPRKDDIAVVIGVEHYQSLPNADYSKSDAGIMKDYLKALGFQERNIEFLTDERATKSGIEKSIEAWLPNRVKKDSRVFVYYSGHGAPDSATGAAYLVPYDGDPNYLSVTGYPLKRLYESLGKLPASEIVVVLDSCFSGAGGRSVLAKGARPLVMMTEGTILPANVAVLSATQGSQISTSSPEKGHGIFTYYFIKAVKDGKKSLSEIYEYIKPLVEDEAKTLNVQQSPGLNPDIEKVKGRFNLRK